MRKAAPKGWHNALLVLQFYVLVWPTVVDYELHSLHIDGQKHVSIEHLTPLCWLL